MNNDLKEIREQYKISMTQASIDTGIPIRTYSRYENDSNYGSVLKREAIKLKINILNKKYEITEDKGILNIDDLRAGVLKIIANHLDEIDFCYLFGSYAKGYATEKSDIDFSSHCYQNVNECRMYFSNTITSAVPYKSSIDTNAIILFVFVNFFFIDVTIPAIFTSCPSLKFDVF